MFFARQKCVEGNFHGTRVSHFIMRRLLIPFGLIIAAMLSSQVNTVSGQAYRRPSSGTITPAMEAYRNRWMEYLKQRTTSTTTNRPFSWPGLRVGNEGTQNDINQDSLVINGFNCERTFSLFPNKSNPRMYHLCARRGDGWYVYHYFCPHGTSFHDGTKKCMQEHHNPAINNNANTVRTTTVRIRRTTTTPPPPTTTTRRSMTTTLRTTTITPSTEPVPDAEPGVTESSMFSSEESSTEDELYLRDVFVSNSASSSDEAEEVNSESDDATSDDINMIPVSANRQQSRLPSQSQSQTKKTKNKEAKAKSSSSGEDVAAGERRPRLLKKWRLQFNKY